MKKLALLLFLLAPICLAAQPKIQLQNFATGFDLPLDITHCGDSRLFVTERDGVIWVLDSLGNRLDTFLNIDPRVNSGQNEQGLLGLAFHPNYAENGFFFVNYTKNNGGTTRIARFSVKPNNPNEADPNSELMILEQSQPYWNHNGGCIKFGPDGYLYTSIGDGGSGNDPHNNGQNKKTFLGKILRIDVNNSNASEPYVVPADNPFVGNSDYFPEIWSLGWRNPWRFSFDRLTGDMWIGDVGQNLWEEVDFELAGAGGLNYGWRCYEGTHDFNLNGCQAASNYVMPFFEYPHSGGNGCSVTGGFIYRGSKYPDLYGCYLFVDYCSGRWWYTRRNDDGTFTTKVLATLSGYEYSSLGEDRDGELYVALLGSGRVMKVKELCSPFQLVLNSIEHSCAGSPSGLIDLSSTGGTGTVNYSWSQGSGVYLYPGTYTVTATDGNGCSRVESYEILQIGPDLPTLSASNSVVCPNGSITLTAGNLPVPSSLTWYNESNVVATTEANSPTAELTVSEPGNYTVVIEDSVCLPISPVVSISLVPVIVPELSSSGDTIFSSLPCGQCSWYFNNQLIAGASENYYVATESGNYSLTIVTPEGCSVNSGSINITISSAALPTWARRFSLSPNPTDNNVLLAMELDVKGKTSIVLTDSSQRQVYFKSFDSPKISEMLEMKALPVGTYVLKIQTELGSFARQIVKQ